jgi:hypothetical protein
MESVDDALLHFPVEHRRQVLEPNLRHARQIVRRIRASTKGTVIDPSVVLPVVGWQQKHWLAFWETVIIKFTAAVVFIDGWEFSFGCAHEMGVAFDNGVGVFDERGRAISMRDAADRLHSAIVQIQSYGMRVDKLQLVAQHLASSPLTPVRLSAKRTLNTYLRKSQ